MEHGFEGFSLAYQPQIDAATGRVGGAEALARWTCPEYGNVPPDEFIPLLESSGLIVPVGVWVLNQAVQTCTVSYTHLAWCVLHAACGALRVAFCVRLALGKGCRTKARRT